MEDMKIKIVIQCCKSKNKQAGTFTNNAGEKIILVAHPEQCSQLDQCMCKPDDKIGFRSGTWRDYLIEYNRKGTNPNNLSRAAELFRPAIYKDLVEKYCWSNVFILSAGWGLIRSNYLIPHYDITFSAQAKKCFRRRWPNENYSDFSHLQNCEARPDERDETIYFFGGKDYLPLYYSLTQHIKARKVIYCAANNLDKHQGYEYIRYDRKHTNWHYSCARDFMAGRIKT
jgi:hypothetical protein